MARPDMFTNDEKRWLIENYAEASWEDILSALPTKTKTQIMSKAYKMGISREKVNFAKFSEDEDTIIRLYYREYRAQGIIDNFLPNRTYSSIVSRASKLGVHTRGDWTECEDAIIISSYYEMPMSALAKLLPSREKSAIHCRIKQLGLSGAPMYKYSDEDIDFVKNNYENMADEELGKVLHRAPASIKEMRRKNKIYRKNPNLPTNYLDVLKFIQAHNTEWKKKSMEHCGYKCVLSGGTFDDIHHLYAKNLILTQALQNEGLEMPEDINACSAELKERILSAFLKEQSKYPLGVCLRKYYHKRFHAMYGFGNNTPEQFYEFSQLMSPASEAITTA